MATSVFANDTDLVWKWRYAVSLVVSRLAGGIPTDENVAKSWLLTKIEDKGDAVRRAVAETMAARAVTPEEAVDLVGSAKHFTGFKKDDTGLYIEGRQIKAAIKEAVSAGVGSGHLPLRSWGETKKFAKGFVAEHIMVVEDRIYLHRDGEVIKDTSDGNVVRVVQQFVHTQYGSAPHYKEYVEDVELKFTVIADYDFEAAKANFWNIVWQLGQQQGLGASRSGGFGRYVVTSWDLVSKPPKRRAKKIEQGESE
jgi:hypothetical protein